MIQDEIILGVDASRAVSWVHARLRLMLMLMQLEERWVWWVKHKE